VTYNAEITKFQRQIDKLDLEIFEKIVELAEAVKHLKHKIENIDRCPTVSYISLVNSKIEKLAQQYKLDTRAIAKIFKEIIRLIDEKEVNLH
jgi:hypothetical protein